MSKIIETPHRKMTLQDWKSLALETGKKLAFAVANIKAPGLIFSVDDKGNSSTKRWEDDVVETLQKFPGAKIDREALSEKYLARRERVKLAKKKAQKKEVESSQ